MSSLYARQAAYFRKAYETGEHGWPVEGPTPQVAALVARLGPGRGRKALDLGCGEGRHSIHLARRGWDVTALDLEPRALAEARARARKAGVRVRFVRGNALDLRFPDGRFDLVLDYGCFHHIVRRDGPRYRRGLRRVLVPGGALLLSVFSTKFRHHAGERRTRDWLVHRNHYDRFFTRAGLRDEFRDSFDMEAVLEEHEGLNGFWHGLFRARKDA
jgi:ubiquinone/menaquinone biosynthesis C-methylase UbiE